MAEAPIRTVLNVLRKRFAPDDAQADGRLLEAFVRNRDEQAFAELLRRHGPLVLGVCRHVVRDPHRAEDAFQATFLVAGVEGTLDGVGYSKAAGLVAVSLRDPAGKEKKGRSNLMLLKAPAWER